MNGEKLSIDDQMLIELLEHAFGIQPREWKEAELERARKATFIYGSLQEFLNDTGWSRDNPELSSGEYLEQMKICRLIDGRYIYFSRLIWET